MPECVTFLLIFRLGVGPLVLSLWICHIGFSKIASSPPIFTSALSDCDPEACEQEPGGVYGTLQGEQVSKREERLRDPFLPRDEFSLFGQDEHPKSQAGEQLDGALTSAFSRSELSATSHPLVLLSSMVAYAYTHTHTPWMQPATRASLYVTGKTRGHPTLVQARISCDLSCVCEPSPAWTDVTRREPLGEHTHKSLSFTAQSLRLLSQTNL